MRNLAGVFNFVRKSYGTGLSRYRAYFIFIVFYWLTAYIATGVTEHFFGFEISLLALLVLAVPFGYIIHRISRR
jgi:hypothetical protein